MQVAWLVLAISASLARAEVPNVVVTAESVDVVSRYRGWAESVGLKGAQQLPACRAWSEAFYQCFTVQDEGKYRMVHLGDLEEWGATLVDLEAKARLSGRPVLEESARQAVRVEGIEQPYWLFDSSLGHAPSALLYVAELEEALGGKPAFAVPARGVVIAWVPGDPELDQVVSIGVTRIHAEASAPVSSVIVHWTGEGWARWGEAKEAP